MHEILKYKSLYTVNLQQPIRKLIQYEHLLQCYLNYPIERYTIDNNDNARISRGARSLNFLFPQWFVLPSKGRSGLKFARGLRKEDYPVVLSWFSLRDTPSPYWGAGGLPKILLKGMFRHGSAIAAGINGSWKEVDFVWCKGMSRLVFKENEIKWDSRYESLR